MSSSTSQIKGVMMPSDPMMAEKLKDRMRQ